MEAKDTELSKNYIPGGTEEKWYRHWMQKGYFRSVPDSRPAYTIVIPPPNVTGVLHMGHTLNETVQDILARTARMNGFNVCWVPGSDHASIATESKVVQMLREKGIEKSSLTREAFLEYAFEWKEKYGGIIYDQIRKLGCSVDWERVNFTMDDHYYKAVIQVFTDLYRKGLIYRGARMINWDPAAQTALSDEEVEYSEVRGKLYYIKYLLADSADGENFVTIATQRPETIMGDTAVCVNPSDERYAHLRGRQVIVPLVNRKVDIIFDEYVDREFGTGALKVTPAHDINDYNLGLKHQLAVIDTLNPDGTISEAAQVFVGLDRFEARRKAIAQLKQEGLLLREEEYTTRIGKSQRSGAVVEPRISTQWFVKMKELAGPALDAVLQGHIRIHPTDKFLATYRYWLENVKDWCISRQLWWGQQIPAWYDRQGNVYVGQTREEAIASAPGAAATVSELVQDEDVLDTWFSSWLWPMEVFHGITQPGNKDINYYYPTSVLVTGQDIIFFWVARMIMAGMEYMNERPFRDVYFTGMVRDKQGRKMSKTLGNSPDLLALIEQYGADAVRFGSMISAPAGNDLLFDEAALEQGRHFNNKLWNALKLVKKLGENRSAGAAASRFAPDWFAHRLNKAKKETATLMEQFRLSEALKNIYSLIWDDFCSWYLEWIKPPMGEPVSETVYAATVDFFEELLALLHPFMPFITEEIYHLLAGRSDDLCIRQSIAAAAPDGELLRQGALLQQAISAIRDAKNKNRMKPKDAISLYWQTSSPALLKAMGPLLTRQVYATGVEPVAGNMKDMIVVAVENDKFYFSSGTEPDAGIVKEDLLKDLAHQKQFLESVLRKLANDRFVRNAKPEVIALERKKQADTEARIRTLEESISGLRN